MSENLSMQEQWDKSGIIAKHLGETKNIVYYELWRYIAANDLVEKACNNDLDTINQLKGELEIIRKNKQSINSRKSESPDPFSHNKRKYTRTKYEPKEVKKAETPSDKLKVALWYIKTIGSAKEAKRILEIAILASQEVEPEKKEQKIKEEIDDLDCLPN